jgi:hypothetical protein
MSDLELAMEILKHCNAIKYWVEEYKASPLVDKAYRATCHKTVGDEWVALVAVFLKLQSRVDRMTILPLIEYTNEAQDSVVPVLNLVMPTE